MVGGQSDAALVIESGEEIFLENGGESFTLIPCLNDDERWIQTLHGLIHEKITVH